MTITLLQEKKLRVTSFKLRLICRGEPACPPAAGMSAILFKDFLPQRREEREENITNIVILSNAMTKNPENDLPQGSGAAEKILFN